MLLKQGKKPLLVAADVYRPAAIKQLQVVGSQAGVAVFEMGTEKPVKICKEAIRRGVHKVFIIDGRVSHSILVEILSDSGIGTMFINED